MLFDDFLREFQILQPYENRCEAGSDIKKVVLLHVIVVLIINIIIDIFVKRHTAVASEALAAGGVLLFVITR